MALEQGKVCEEFESFEWEEKDPLGAAFIDFSEDYEFAKAAEEMGTTIKVTRATFFNFFVKTENNMYFGEWRYFLYKGTWLVWFDLCKT